MVNQPKISDLISTTCLCSFPKANDNCQSSVNPRDFRRLTPVTQCSLKSAQQEIRVNNKSDTSHLFLISTICNQVLDAWSYAP